MILPKLRSAFSGWLEDEASQMGAALAYYTLFSLTPLLVLAVTIIGLLVGEVETREQVVMQVKDFLGAESAEAVRSLLDAFRTTHPQVGASVIGLLSLWFGSTGMFTSLRSSLWRIWRLPPVHERAFARLVKTHLLSTLMVLVSFGFIMILLMVSAVTPLLAARWGKQLSSIPWGGVGVDFLLSTLLLTLLFTLTFRVLSDGRIAYRAVLRGAVVSAMLFTIGKIVIGYYLSFVNLASGFGTAGSLVVFLAWVYYSSQIVFFGAEVVRAELPRAEGGTG